VDFGSAFLNCTRTTACGTAVSNTTCSQRRVSRLASRAERVKRSSHEIENRQRTRNREREILSEKSCKGRRSQLPALRQTCASQRCAPSAGAVTRLNEHSSMLAALPAKRDASTERLWQSGAGDGGSRSCARKAWQPRPQVPASNILSPCRRRPHEAAWRWPVRTRAARDALTTSSLDF
jgi:hypothetical protein